MLMIDIRDEYLNLIADAIKQGECTPMHDADAHTIYFINDRATLNADAKLSYAFDKNGIGVKLFIRGECVVGKPDEYDRFEFGDGLNFQILLDEIQSVADEAKCDPMRV